MLVPALLVVLAASAIAAPVLDRGFGDDGVVRTQLPEPLRFGVGSSSGPLITDLAMQRRGRMVGALGSGTELLFAGAVRYLADGNLDRRFGEAGVVSLPSEFGALREAQAEVVSVQRDRKVLIAGYRDPFSVRDSQLSTAPFLVRLLPDGKLDYGFGHRGLATNRLRGRGGDRLHGVAVQPNGRIIAVGGRNERLGTGPKAAGLVVVYRPNGRIDHSFGTNGRTIFPHLRSGYTSLRDVAVLPSGKLLVVGYLADRLFIARLRRDGRLDHSFGRGGKILRGKDLGACCPSDAEVSVLPGGDFVVLAVRGFGSYGLYRFHGDGRPVRAFGTRGVASGRWIRRVGEAGGLAVQANGRIVVAGTAGRVRADDSAKGVFSVVRALPSGKPDRSFGKNGAQFIPLGYNSAGAAALTLGNGQVVVAGGTQVRAAPDSGFDFAYDLVLARLRASRETFARRGIPLR